MKKIILRLILIISVFILNPKISSATHMAGADISYSYVSNNNFLVRVKFYRNCQGIPLNASINWNVLCVSSASSGQSFSVIMDLVSSTAITNNPCALLPPPNCSSGSGYEENLMEDTVTLPMAASDWVFGYATGFRDLYINTLNGAGRGMYVSATLDNLNHPTDNSPVFNILPYNTFCLNNAYYFDDGAVDPDHDSLVFSLAPAVDATNLISPPSCPYIPNSIPYNSPYTPTQPVASSVPVSIADSTGIIHFIPSLQQMGVICVVVSSFDTTVRPATYIGSIKRDFEETFLQGIIGINELENDKEQLVVHPNPSTGIVYLDNGETLINEIQLMGITGSVLMAQSTNSSKANLDLGKYSSGLYILSIVSGNKIKHRKLQIIH